MMSSANDKWIALTQAPGIISDKEVGAVFHQLPPLSMKSLFGEWLGADLNSGHPGIKKNRDHKWAGKSFVSVDDVKPMMVYDDNGNRVWDGAVSGACIREIRYHDVVSAAMIYLTKPLSIIFEE